MNKAWVAVALLLLASQAQAYSKPQGAPELVLPDYGLTISVFAVKTPLGEGIGVLEYRPLQQDWSLCGNCVTSLEYPDMTQAVKAYGGGDVYLRAKRGEINDILARRYPGIGAPVTGLELVNSALKVPGVSLGLVNGIPTLVLP